MISCQPIPRGARRRAVALAAGVVLADQTTKLAAELLSGGHRHGPLVPLRNPRFPSAWPPPRAPSCCSPWPPASRS
jgi:hypothetical protein